MPSSTSSTSANPAKTSNFTRESTQETSQGSQTMAMMATTSRPYAYTQEYSLPSEFESQAWFTDSDASHHLTSYASLLKNKIKYVGANKVYVGNGQTLSIHLVGSTQFYSNINPKHKLILTNILCVPSITRNLLFITKFSSDNNVVFEFLPDKCYIKF